MKKIGILFGREDSFQWALIDRINQKQVTDLVAEAVKVGHVEMGRPAGYALILDRISHDIPFFKVLLKNEVSCGTQVLNDPFWSLADDRFFQTTVATRLGVAVPRTVLLPHRDHPPDTNAMSMRNLQYPLDWEGLFAHVGFPAYLRPHQHGWQHAHEISGPEELFHVYSQTGTTLMMLQERIEYEAYYRCYCIGREAVRIVPYDPRAEHVRRYQPGFAPLSDALRERLERDTLAVNRALGYDVNAAEFAVRDGVPHAIDLMNPAPDADRHSVGEETFEWLVETVASLLIERVLHPEKALAWPTTQVPPR